MDASNPSKKPKISHDPDVPSKCDDDSLKKSSSSDDSDDFDKYNFQFIKSEDELLLVKKLVKNATAGEMKPPTTKKAIRERIIQLKDEINHLVEIKQLLCKLSIKLVDDLKKRKEEELSACYDSFSPLLCLGHSILSEMLEFCDENALLRGERASRTLHNIAMQYGHWQRLHRMHERLGMYQAIRCLNRYDIPKESPAFRFHYPAEKKLAEEQHQQNYFQELPREELVASQARLFGVFSGTAEQLEKLSEKHYHCLQGYSKLDGVTVRRYMESLDFLPNYKLTSRLGEMRFFLRFSRWDASQRRQLRLMWQGFVSSRETHYGESYCGILNSEEFDLTDQIRSIDWPEFQDFFSWMTTSTSAEKKRYKKKNQRFREFVQNMRLTLVCCDGERRLVSGGCRRVKGDEAVLHLKDSREEHSSYGAPRRSQVCIKNQKLFFRVDKQSS